MNESAAFELLGLVCVQLLAPVANLMTTGRLRGFSRRFPHCLAKVVQLAFWNRQQMQHLSYRVRSLLYSAVV